MRGPLLLGPIGSPATLERLRLLVGERRPVVVLSALWLAAELASVVPVVLLCEPELRARAKRALRRAAKAGRALAVAVAGETLPLAAGAAGALVVEGLADTAKEDACTFMLGLGRVLAPEGLVIGLDGTREAAAEARVAGVFLGAGLRGVSQERPKEGALLTVARAPLPEVLAARGLQGEVSHGP